MKMMVAMVMVVLLEDECDDEVYNGYVSDDRYNSNGNDDGDDND